MTSDQASTSAPLTIITGASSGIGRELALQAARRGEALVVVARGTEALEALATEARAVGSPHVDAFAADLATAEGCELAAARARAVAEQTGHAVTTLVNNAGYGTYGALADTDVDPVNGMVDLNCRAVAHLTRLLLADIVKARGGILTVASTAAFQPGPGMAVYSASKAFALSFSVAMREELRGTGVHVTTLCPGPVATGFQHRAGVANMRITKVAEHPVDKVASAAWEGLRRNRAVVVPGVANKLVGASAKLTPRTTATRIARRALGALPKP